MKVIWKSYITCSIIYFLCMCGHTCTVSHPWRSEDNSQEAILFFSYGFWGSNSVRQDRQQIPLSSHWSLGCERVCTRTCEGWGPLTSAFQVPGFIPMSHHARLYWDFSSRCVYVCGMYGISVYVYTCLYMCIDASACVFVGVGIQVWSLRQSLWWTQSSQ